jgi:hypothetical protein
VPEDYFERKSRKIESISDEEIRLAIRYLDPEPQRRANGSDASAFIAVFMIVCFLCAILISLRLRGL